MHGQDLLDDVAKQLRDLRANLVPVVGSYSGTTDSSGQLTVTHSAGFTPSAVSLTDNTGAPAASDRGVPGLFSVNDVTMVIQYMQVAGSVATLAVAGSYVLYP